VLAIAGASQLQGCSDAAAVTPADPVVLSFATVGDSREDPTTTTLTAQDKIWLQNSKVWSRMMGEIQLKQPSLLFFNGDMIMGYKDASVAANHEAMNQQYAYWRGMVSHLFEAGTYVVPVPGNHEVQEKGKTAAGVAFKEARVANEILWRDNMGDLILDATRFPAVTGKTPAHFDVANNPFTAATAAADNITTDQAKLSYSFDVGDSHFVVVNTDPYLNDAHIATGWLSADLSTAQTNGAKHFFIFGHKPAYSYLYTLADGTKAPTNGLDSLADHTNRDAFWALVETYKATYFCGHEHIYNAQQPGGAGKAWEVIVGSGGSPFEATALATAPGLPTDRTYAYAIVDVLQSGKVHVTTYGFPENLGPTTVLANWDL
jgi:hypothetical protein